MLELGDQNPGRKGGEISFPEVREGGGAVEEQVKEG